MSKIYIPFLLFICLIYLTPCYGELEKISEPSNTNSLELSPQLENLGRLFKDDSNRYLQEFWILGRYHGQYHWSHHSDGGNSEGYESRRLRLGAQAKLFGALTFHAQMVSGSDVSPFYNGFSELWTEWKFSKSLRFSIGQQKNRFTHDRNVSSRYLNYLERSMLTNMFAADYTPAITLQGEVDKLTYYTGFFTNKTSSNIGDAFTDLNSGYSYIGALYYNLENKFFTDATYLYLSYIHSSANSHATNLNNFNNGISTALISTIKSLSLVTEVTTGIGSSDGSALGFNIQPSYFLTDRLQLATRYQLAFSDNKEGLSAQRRYERSLDFSKGDLYNAAYVGLNYYLLRHRLKLMSGLELSRLDGREVLTSSVMLRLYFGPHSGGAFPMDKTLPGNFLDYD